MIVDVGVSAPQYFPLHPLLCEAFLFLRQQRLISLPDGTYPIRGNNLYAVVSHPPACQGALPKLEAHRRYIDIHYVLKGADVIGWRHVKECTRLQKKYSPVKDIQFFNDSPRWWATIPSGSFALCFPNDAHAPCAGLKPCHKIVLKVLKSAINR
jgi:YhcH/YjgK/YiaL family protein